MKNLLYLLFTYFIVSCSTSHKENKVETKSLDTLAKTTNRISQPIRTNITVAVCSCKSFNKFKNRGYHRTNIRFQKGRIENEISDFERYSHDSLKETVKSIRFTNYDTIPPKFAIFSNIEHIVFSHRRDSTFFGFDMFPKLKSVFFWGCKLTINPSDKWLQRIEGIYAEKSSIRGLKSFKSTPNLKEIYFGHASLDPFPTDFDNLKCLQRITLGAYRGDIDLSKFNLRLNPCLERVEFSTWYDAFSGIPQGVDTNRSFKLIINHQKLSKEEKEKIREYNANKKPIN